MVSMQPASDGFRGFDEARTIMWCHEARARIHTQLDQTAFLADERVHAVHVDDTTRGDRCFLTAFDPAGTRLSADTLYIDDPSQRLDVTPEFDHDFTGMAVPEGSDLRATIAREDGWVIDMAALRAYDPLEDRRATQRAVFLAHMGDMVTTGQVRGFSLSASSDDSSARLDDEDDESAGAA